MQDMESQFNTEIDCYVKKDEGPFFPLHSPNLVSEEECDKLEGFPSAWWVLTTVALSMAAWPVLIIAFF